AQVPAGRPAALGARGRRTPMTCPRRQLGINGVRCAKEHPENMAAQRTARRFNMVMPAGNAAHMEARIALGWGSPATRSVLWGGAVARLEVQAGARRPRCGGLSVWSTACTEHR
ncbi:MAG: hypothetical protein WAN44_09490, partial [Propionibacteriaceae bacterium]